MHATADVNLRVSLRNLLFLTDFSPASELAVPYLVAVAEWYGAKVYVLHTVPSEAPMPLPMEPLPVSLDLGWQRAKLQMQEFVAGAAFKSLDHAGLVQEGEFWPAISSVIHDHSIDMIVLGTHGRSGLKKVALGSMAEEVFRHALCPVLTVGPHCRPSPGRFDEWKRILFATDFSPASLRALPYAFSLAEENEAELILLHMLPLVPMQQQDSVREAIIKRLSALVPAEVRPWCRPRCQVRFDFAIDGIRDAANEVEADVIVMGVHHVRSPKATSHLLWATAYEVVCQAPCPVLTVRD